MPVIDNKSEMQELLNDIHVLRDRTYQMIDLDEPTMPGPPMTETQIDEFEKALRLTLPRSYRLFLSLHNGWESWSGDVALLSTEQMLKGKYAERIAKWRKDERTLQPALIDHCLVIGLSLYVGEQVLLDFSIPGRCEVVTWEHGETSRFLDFSDYLLNFKSILQRELAGDRAE